MLLAGFSSFGVLIFFHLSTSIIVFYFVQFFMLFHVKRSLLHLMRAITYAHAGTCIASLMRVKKGTCHFCLQHLLSVTLEEENERKN